MAYRYTDTHCACICHVTDYGSHCDTDTFVWSYVFYLFIITPDDSQIYSIVPCKWCLSYKQPSASVMLTDSWLAFGVNQTLMWKPSIWQLAVISLVICYPCGKQCRTGQGQCGANLHTWLIISSDRHLRSQPQMMKHIVESLMPTNETCCWWPCTFKFCWWLHDYLAKWRADESICEIDKHFIP